MTNETTKDTENFEMDEEIAVKEKLNPKDDLASPSKVKFTAEGKNGEAKVDVENSYGGSVGMSKEELMKYANDPFWVRLRMFLFILFWVVWIAMLIGAIVIIAVAPKCPPTSSLPWWQKTTAYQVYVRSFKDSNGDGEGDIRGLINKLDYFKEIGVETLILSPIYPSTMKDSGYDVTNFNDIDPRYGSLDDFNELVEKLHGPETNMRVIIDFIPNHTSDKHPWFEASKRNESQFADYYVWRDPNITSGTRQPPNNWLSVFGGSAWTWNEDRKQYYLHQFLPEQPDLNLRNPEVKKALKDVLQFWMKRKVDGIRIDAVSHLYEDESFSDEKVIKEGSNDYDSLEHDKTTGQSQNYDLIREWRKVVKQAGLKKILISESYEPTEKLVKYYGTSHDPLVDLPFNLQLTDLSEPIDANQLKSKVESWINATKPTGLEGDWPSDAKPPGPWSAWVTGNHDKSRLATRLGHKLADAMLMLTFLLPRNTPVVYYGDEIGMTDQRSKIIPEEPNLSRLAFRSPMQWNSSASAGFSDNNTANPWINVSPGFTQHNVEVELKSNSTSTSTHLKLFKSLVDLRKTHSETIILGDTMFPLPNSSTIFVMSRHSKGYNGYLLAINFGSIKQKVKLDNSHLPQKGKIYLTDSESPLNLIGQKIDFSELQLEPSQSLIIEYSFSE